MKNTLQEHSEQNLRSKNRLSIYFGKVIETFLGANFKKNNLFWMKKTIFIIAVFIGFYQAQGQSYTYISNDALQKFMRFNIGYTNFSMKLNDSTTKVANGLYLNNEVKLISGFFKGKYFTVHDAFYLGIDLGIMTSQKQKKPDRTEGSFSYSANTGYVILAGYRDKKWGALAGVDFKYLGTNIGNVTMPNLDGKIFHHSRAFVVRGEYNLSREKNRRIIGTFWYDAGNNTSRAPYQSVRVEVGLGGSYWLLFQQNRQKALGENHFMGIPPAEMVFNQFIVGLRIGLLP